jgi:hypothetical protein
VSSVGSNNSSFVPPSDLSKIAKANKNILYSDINSGD